VAATISPATVVKIPATPSPSLFPIWYRRPTLPNLVTSFREWSASST
jgi:hypothetical protein